MPLPEPTVHILKPGTDAGSFLIQKLDLKSDDIISVRGINDHKEFEFIEHKLNELGIENAALMFTEGVELKNISEKEMNEAGWYRKLPAKKTNTRKRGATRK